MPAPVDKEAVRLEIIKACQRCAEDKPLPEVSLRDVAGKLGVTHASLLYYFNSKDDLLMACGHWAGGEFCKMIRYWFDTHDLADYPSGDDYLNAFIEFTLEDKSNETLPRGVVMNCALGEYSAGLKKVIEQESDNIRAALKYGLEKAFDRSISEDTAGAMLVIFYGVYFCAFNNALVPGQTKAVVSCIRQLLDMDTRR